MAVNLSPIGGVAGQFFDNNGNPLAGGKIFTYAAGTTTNQATYTSASGVIAHSNPIILDAAGRVPSGEIWLTDGLQYKFVIKTSTDVLIGTYDNIIGINSNFINFLTETEIQTATAGQTVFTLTTMDYQPGTNSLSVFVDGVNQYDGVTYAYVETSSTVVTFTAGLHVGALVKFTTAQTLSSGVTDASLVTYDPPFANSVPTNVEAKLSEYVSVKDFGAVGDGVTDDGAAIQAAIDAVGKGGAVYFPQGTYNTTQTLNIAPTSGTSTEINLFADNNTTTIKADANGLVNLFYVTGSQTFFNDLSIDCNSTDLTNGINVDISGNSDIGCTIKNCKVGGFPVGINLTGQNHYLDNNFFQNNDTHIKFADDGRNTSVSNNYMLGGDIGIEITKTTQQAEGLRIINNTILATGGNGAAIDITAGLEITLIGNIFDQTGVDSTCIYSHPTGGDAVSSFKLIGNWIAAGENAYGFLATGNTNHLYFTNNTFVSNNGLVTLDAINLTGTNTYCLIGNRFLMNLDVGSLDLKVSGSSNSTVFGNDSIVSGSLVYQNAVNGDLNVTTEIRTTENIEGKIFVFVDTSGNTVSWIQSGTGSPNGVVNAISGTLFMRTDGSVGNRLYVCQTGTTWLAVAGV